MKQLKIILLQTKKKKTQKLLKQNTNSNYN